MLEAIYASKLYRSSTRKDRIQSAWNNPVNSELVGQLASALGEEYQRPEYLSKAKESEAPSSSDTNVDPDVSDNNKVEPSSSAPHVGPSSHGPSLSSDSEVNDISDDSADPSAAEPASEPTSDAGDSPDVVEESTTLLGSAILGSVQRAEFKDMRQVADQIKGMLNFKDSTTGVNRILKKDCELWIYYNDDINLNNVMADVIELLNASGYTYLEFNRLARSDNAIVFQIDFADTDNVTKQLNTNK